MGAGTGCRLLRSGPHPVVRGNTCAVFRQCVRRRDATRSTPVESGSGQSPTAASVPVSASRGMRWSRHSRRSVPMTRSAIAFHAATERAWRWRRCQALGSPAEVAPVDRIAIAQQMARLAAPGRRLDQLSPDPGRRRVRRHVDMQQLAPAMGNRHEHVHRHEREGGDREQVGGPEVMRMVAQEHPPGLACRARRWAPAVTSDRAAADVDAELDQLAPDALGAPESVLARHGPDEILHLGAEMRVAASGAGLPMPEQAPALSMPAHHRVRRDDRQVVTPAATPSARRYPEQLVPGAKASTGSGPSRTGQHRESMA
jgi:hypothetical protein